MITLGIGKKYLAVVLTEIAVIVQVTGCVSGGIIRIHFYGIAHQIEYTAADQCCHDQYEDNNYFYVPGHMHLRPEMEQD